MNSQSLFNYTLVLAEESSSVTILERQQTGETTDADQYYSGIVEVVAEENAYVQYGALQNLSEETYNFQVKRGHADTYATVNWIDGNIGSRLTKSNVETRLLGDSSESQILGAFFGHEDQHFDIASRVWHEAEHTIADLVTRGVLDDDARSVYEAFRTSVARPGTRRRTSVRTRSCSLTTPRPTHRRSSSSTTTTPRPPTPRQSGRSTKRTCST